jgi:hypothetical protein
MSNSPKTVIRGGFGMFYQRFDIVDVLAAERYNGSTQQQYVVVNPDFFLPFRRFQHWPAFDPNKQPRNSAPPYERLI